MIIIQRMCGESLPELEAILDRKRILVMMAQAQSVYLDPKLMQYIVELVDATRKPEQKGILYGSSPAVPGVGERQQSHGPDERTDLRHPARY